VSESYAKLFNTITTSTIWSEPMATRVVWVTMLAMADRHGEVQASVPGLARVANVPMDDCLAALATFLAPDQYSRTPDNEGRRIEVVEGGWRLLNHAKYRAKRDAEDRKERQAQWIADKRARSSKAIDKRDNVDSSVDTDRQVDESRRSRHITASASASEDQKQESASPVGDASPAKPLADGKRKRKPSAKGELTFDEWFAAIPDGEDVIRDDDPICDDFDALNIPMDWRGLAWAAFAQKYRDQPKRYSDWRAVYRRAVREDWIKVWRALPDGALVLTTVGEQLRRKLAA